MPTTAMWATRRPLTGGPSVLDRMNHAVPKEDGAPYDGDSGKTGSVQSPRERLSRIAAYVFIYAAYGFFAAILAYSVLALVR